jgi:hypothetical protein
MLMNLIALEKIGRSPRVVFEARVEELLGMCEARPGVRRLRPAYYL